MSSTEATAYAINITKLVVPAWSLGPYYVQRVAEPYVVLQRVPQNLLNAWDAAFPYHTWQWYSPTVEAFYTGGGTQNMNAMISGNGNIGPCYLSVPQIGVERADGVNVSLLPGIGGYGILLNEKQYPRDIPQVRQALAYAINRSEVASTWQVYLPYYNVSPFPPGEGVPSWISKETASFPYDPAKAASILQGLGFYKKNGIWYTPNGTELSLAIQGPTGWTDWDTTVEEAANELTSFGIPTSLYADSVGTYLGTILPTGDFQAAIEWLPGAASYESAWAMGNVWTSGDFPTWNVTANYEYVWPNGTKAFFNMTKWYVTFASSTVGSQAYNASLAQYIAFL